MRQSGIEKCDHKGTHAHVVGKDECRCWKCGEKFACTEHVDPDRERV